MKDGDGRDRPRQGADGGPERLPNRTSDLDC
jgi:hypothetical protein